MPTAYITHPDCLLHETGHGHPENASRLHAINDRLVATQLSGLLAHYDAPLATEEQLSRVHDLRYIQALKDFTPTEGLRHIDFDTPLGPHSYQAALRAAGANVLATELVIDKKVNNAFCAVRPPGHHAERTEAMGFCFFNNIAVGVAHALEKYGLQRVAIVDFDVHHGNGSEDIFRHNEKVMVCSSFQHPFYPNRPFVTGGERLINVPLPGSTTSLEFREAIRQHWVPALHGFKPQMLFISAGFDAHAADDMSSIRLVDGDYDWITRKLMQIADQYCEGRIVSTLEGGYELHSLARSVEAHLKALMGI